MSPREPALFDTLNAKKMTPSEIANYFVIPRQYEQLVTPDHSILLGPRGSGKTTLLRMLQGESLMSWKDNSQAQFYRRNIKYTSVFLPADQLWSSQVDESNVDSRVGLAAFTTQLLSSLVEMMLYRIPRYSQHQEIHSPSSISVEDEILLVRECSNAWKIELNQFTLLSLQGQLDLRLMSISEMSSSISLDQEFDAPNWLKIDPIRSFSFGIRSFNRYNLTPNHRWAILLDEMELAPVSVHNAMRNALRGGDPLLILKMSMAPSSRFALGITSDTAPMANNDFLPIYLWYGRRTESRRITDGLWRRILQEAKGVSKRPAEVLGMSAVDTNATDWKRKVNNLASPEFALIRRMNTLDAGFRQFLQQRHIEIDDLDELSYNVRSATLRKVYPILVFRNALRKFGDEDRQWRTREKLPELFAGVDFVYAALEGNPRWIKAVFNRMFENYPGHGKLPPGAQYDALVEAAERFESLLRLLPSSAQYNAPPILDLLDTIARYFRYRTLGAFTADPPSSFLVDEAVPSEIIDALRRSLLAGAVIHVRSRKSPSILNELTGERFRLAYLLAVRHDLEFPLRLGKHVQLSTILAWGERSVSDVDGISARTESIPSLWSSDSET